LQYASVKGTATPDNRRRIMIRKRTVSVSLAVAASLLLAGIAVASEAADETIRLQVTEALASEGFDNVVVEGVSVEQGRVTLRGDVRSIWYKERAIEIALDVEEVVAVEDELSMALAESDKDLAQEVAKAVRRYSLFTVFDDVSLEVNNGHVVLHGSVTMPYKSDALEQKVAKVMGVQRVTNKIRKLPTNIGDQRLRSILAYRIYRDSLFREYALRANPPIHVVVERGRVVLTGAVRSNVEKRKAEHIARSTFGVFSVENRLTVGS
jgi:hyperosmotically inducible protein